MCMQLLEVYPNLGPIVDFCVVDLDRQGQGQVRCFLMTNPGAESNPGAIWNYVSWISVLWIWIARGRAR